MPNLLKIQSITTTFKEKESYYQLQYSPYTELRYLSYLGANRMWLLSMDGKYPSLSMVIDLFDRFSYTSIISQSNVLRHTKESLSMNIIYEFDVYESNPSFSEATDEISNLVALVQYCKTNKIEMRLVDVVNNNLVAQFISLDIDRDQEAHLNELCFNFGISSFTKIVEDEFGNVQSRVFDA